jgi:hypothetical protein
MNSLFLQAQTGARAHRRERCPPRRARGTARGRGPPNLRSSRCLPREAPPGWPRPRRQHSFRRGRWPKSGPGGHLDAVGAQLRNDRQADQDQEHRDAVQARLVWVRGLRSSACPGAARTVPTRLTSPAMTPNTSVCGRRSIGRIRWTWPIEHWASWVETKGSSEPPISSRTREGGFMRFRAGLAGFGNSIAHCLSFRKGARSGGVTGLRPAPARPARAAGRGRFAGAARTSRSTGRRW